MSKDPEHENELLNTCLDQNVEEIHQLVEELAAAEAATATLAALLRLLLDRIRLTVSPDDLAALRHQADEIEARLLAAVHPPDRMN
ncbi:MAG TPA: hypothetical protein PLK89_13215 [Acidobacteriota bacterium]|nr:hypothetical protein [Acidobacteriota bacterium]